MLSCIIASCPLDNRMDAMPKEEKQKCMPSCIPQLIGNAVGIDAPLRLAHHNLVLTAPKKKEKKKWAVSPKVCQFQIHCMNPQGIGWCWDCMHESIFFISNTNRMKKMAKDSCIWMDDLWVNGRPFHHQSFMSHEIDGVRKEEDKLTASRIGG